MICFYHLLPITVNVLVSAFMVYNNYPQKFFKQYYMKSFKKSLITKPSLSVFFLFLVGIQPSIVYE